ncbi:MAG TPA: hypothetical protein VF618_08150 [Thermoanaerobaculia bacterium]
MSDPELVARIRSIFLHERASVSISEAATLLGWSAEAMMTAIERGEVEVSTGAAGEAIPLQELFAKALEQWPLELVEESLGDRAAEVLPDALRVGNLTAPLPRYQVAMLAYLARRQQTTIGQLLTHELDELAVEHLHELSSAIPGFAEAFHWPSGNEAS